MLVQPYVDDEVRTGVMARSMLSRTIRRGGDVQAEQPVTAREGAPRRVPLARL
jgi:hypothetical protein